MLSLHDEKTCCTCFAGQGQHGLRSQRCGHEAVWGLGVMRRGMFPGLDSSDTCTSCTCFQFWVLSLEKTDVACWHEFIWIHNFEARLWDLTNHPNFEQPLNSCDCRLHPVGSRICAWGCHIARCAERHFPTLSCYFEAMREAICIHIGQGGAMFSSFMCDLPELAIQVGW